MPWTLEQIERDWLLAGEPLMFPAEEVLQAFQIAENLRGAEWVRSWTYLQDGTRRFGFEPLSKVLWFAKRAQSVSNGANVNDLFARLRAGDIAAESELTAMHLLRSENLDTALEIAPEVRVGARLRKPDFRIAKPGEPWTYVEVTGLRSSNASEQAHMLVGRVAEHVMRSPESFVVEVVLSRIPTDEEIGTLASRAVTECAEPEPRQINVPDLALIIVKPCVDVSVFSPTPIPGDAIARLAYGQAFYGPDQPNRQVIVRMPFSDERAEEILNSEARQLPRDSPGLIMVDVMRQPSAFSSWEALAQRRFTPTQHTRVGGIILFMYATRLTDQGLALLPHVKLLPNPNARIPLPDWIPETVAATREQMRAITGRPD